MELDSLAIVSRASRKHSNDKKEQIPETNLQKLRKLDNELGSPGVDPLWKASQNMDQCNQGADSRSTQE